MNKAQLRLIREINRSKHIYLDNDGFLFDNTDKMNDAAIYTLREVFGVDPLSFPRAKALANLKRYYKANPSVFNRVPWVATQSMELLEKGIETKKDSSVSEFDLFRMSSRAYGAAFLYGSGITAEKAFKKFKASVSKGTGLEQTNRNKVDESIELFESNLVDNLSGETFVAHGITSRMVFETYLGIYFSLFEPKVSPLPMARELTRSLSNFCRQTGRGFGLISNRSADSLLPLLERHGFIGSDMIPREKIIPADPVLGGKPRLHQFRAVIPQGEPVVYFGDLPTDIEVAKVLNETDGDGSSFVVVIPTKFEFSLDENGQGEHNFSEEENNYAVCLSYEQIMEIVEEVSK